MSRRPRIDAPGYPQHIVLRGNNRSDMFVTDAERYFFMNCLSEALAAHECEMHAHVLMTNHVHLLATGRERRSLSRTIQDIGRRFVRFVNKRRGRTGTLFEGRFKSSLIETDRYLLTCMRYIEMNPVRAGMVRHPADHPWSSYRANTSGSPSWPITPHATYLALGATPANRARAYERLFELPFIEEELAAIRKGIRANNVLGGRAFSAWFAGSEQKLI